MNLLLSLLLAFHLAPQPPAPQASLQPPETAPRPQAPAVNVNVNGYIIGSQDQLKITVFDEPDGFVAKIATLHQTLAHLLELTDSQPKPIQCCLHSLLRPLRLE